MRNSSLLILLLVSAVLGILVGYSVWNSVPEPVAPLGELEWLREEFNLDQEQFSKVEKLHQKYLPTCELMCDRVIDAQNRLDAKMMAAAEYNEDLEEELARFSRLKEDCHREMLKHFYEVAAVMTPDQRERYMAKAKKHVTLHDRISVESSEPSAEK